MRQTRRWLASAIKASATETVRLPFNRGAPRRVFIAKRRGEHLSAAPRQIRA